MTSNIMVTQVTKHNRGIIPVMRLLNMSQSQSHNHKTQERIQKVLEQIISYSMATICWPYGKHMYFIVGQLQYVYRLQSVVYKVDQFVLGTLLSSFVFTQGLKL